MRRNLFKTVVDAWRGIEFPLNSPVNIGLMRSNKPMTLKERFSKAISIPYLLYVNRVIVLVGDSQCQLNAIYSHDIQHERRLDRLSDAMQ